MFSLFFQPGHLKEYSLYSNIFISIFSLIFLHLNCVNFRLKNKNIWILFFFIFISQKVCNCCLHDVVVKIPWFISDEIKYKILLRIFKLELFGFWNLIFFVTFSSIDIVGPFLATSWRSL